MTAGRPPKYKTADEMQTAIDKYFKDCEGIKALDDDGKPIYTKYGYLYEKEPEPPTMSGLAIAIGFLDRGSLLDYGNKEEFSLTVRAAKARVEKYAESRLFDKDGANGAKFSLANNFKAWKEKQEVELTGNVIKVEITEE
jgi:hypothetical protein